MPKSELFAGWYTSVRAGYRGEYDVPDLRVSVNMLCLWESSKVYKKIELQWLQESVELRCRHVEKVSEGLVGVSFGQRNIQTYSLPLVEVKTL